MKKYVVIVLLCLVVASFVMCLRPKVHEYVIKDELKPQSMSELASLSDAELERVDIGRMNLICAMEASQAQNFELNKWVKMLDAWAEHIKKAEQRFKPTFVRNPARYDNSYAKFKAVNLVLTLKEDFHCRYQMSLVQSGELENWNSPKFFKNPSDVFLLGLLDKRRGTCTSYAALIVAIGRRLGYPLYLKSTFGHLFCYWDDGVEHFNLDTNGEGVDTPLDETYINGEHNRLKKLTKNDMLRECVMKPLSNAESFSSFLEVAGYCLEANGKAFASQKVYRLALKYRPGASNLKRLASRTISLKFTGIQP